LKKALEDISREMTKNRRNDITKALKDGLCVKQITDYAIVKFLVLKTFSRQDKKLNIYYLDKILFEFSNENNSFAFAVFSKGIPISAVFCVYDRETAYYLMSGYDSANKHRGAGPLAIWESIKYAKLLGLNNFDFEGSMKKEIETYFREFGGKTIPYCCVSKAMLPLEIVLKFFKRNLF
jgi:lipid II:glycine glycyltransferase (peptidoglycan interpeptide bridge formation enzyme)